MVEKKWRNNFGRRRGKALRNSQKFYMQDLEKYCPYGIRLSENPNRNKIKFFNNKNPVWLEIGFGSGEHLFFQAEDGIRDPLWSRGLGDVYKRQDFLGRKQI